MAQAITAMYAQDNDDWSITVAGLGEEVTARAPGIIAARDRVDQLVEKLVNEDKGTTVVHLLNGSALEFTSAYMTARLTRSTAEPLAAQQADEAAEPEAAEVPAQARTENGGPEAETTTKPSKPVVPTKELAKSPEATGTQAGKNAKANPKGKSGQRDSRRKVAR
ncbi:hypothetical protein SAMN05216266_105152 [Amycolatopsis marina]|uniref:Uncharacterized protein n=1 Tax=Amycolatopsis marina TaxID=490629 RepID=A0A1I0YJZ8_9PSEU|nr:hypothetical protein [Amycolatopsis marina]SFB13709.1 hypothetical protein SAMN05216266_105152 [Amycolatopsis marina]